MAPIARLWTGIIYVFDFLTNSPSQPLFPGNTVDLQTPLHPVRPQATKYPIFNPPDELEDIPFRCEYPNYPEKDGWVMCNTNLDRECWLKNTKTGQKFTIHTDYENEGPKGIDRHYYLELGETKKDPDTHGNIPVQLFNGSFPGPRLQACWGDRISITIKNNLNRNESDPGRQPGNGTSVHWHGFRQWNTGHMDGVNAVTQCPIRPGTEFTYEFNATQYGTSWYHSHYSLQYAAGALGPFTIYGPMSKNFDHQLTPIIMSDWLHGSVFEEWDTAITTNGRVFIDNILQNGIGHWPPLNLTDGSKVPEKTKFNELFFQKGVKYLLRLINGAADTTFIFSIDNHKFWVISTDFVAIEPYYTDHVVVGIGQRYNIIVEAIPDKFTADQSYWIRTTPAPKCTAFNTNNPSTLIPDEHTGIVRYTFNRDIPSSERQNFPLNCADESYFKDLKPIVHWTVPEVRHEVDPFYLSFHGDNTGFPYWPCNSKVGRFELVSQHPMWLNFSAPTLLNLDEDFSKKPYLAEVTTNAKEETWVQLTVISGKKSLKHPLLPHPLPKIPNAFVPGQHPIHLHGHDFAILEQCVPDENTACDIAQRNLTLDNPPRRDVAFLPDAGYLIIAFKADNPGVWLMHCHIAFHASSGLAAQILENVDKMKLPFGWDEPFEAMCKNWDDWSPDNSSDPCMFLTPDEEPLQTDSGI